MESKNYRISENRHKTYPANMVIKLKILLNPDKEIVKEVRKQLIRTGGYCPYMLIRSPATLCMCEDFRAKIADPEFEGYCHCLMYYKQK